MKIGQYSIFINFFEKIPDKLITNGCIGARMKIFLNVIGWGGRDGIPQGLQYIL